MTILGRGFELEPHGLRSSKRSDRDIFVILFDQDLLQMCTMVEQMINDRQEKEDVDCDNRRTRK